MKSKDTQNTDMGVGLPEGPKGDDDRKPLEVSTASNALTERIKELNCLYGISNLLENQDVSLSWIMQRAVKLIPMAWQYPENACARIRLDGKEYTSKNFRSTRWRQDTKIILNDKHVGDVAVFYINAPQAGDQEPFLEEEDHLLKAIGERLSKVLWLKRSEEALKESEERYRVLAEQITEGVALVQNSRFCYVNPAFCKMFNVPSVGDIRDKWVDSHSAGDADEIARFYGLKQDDLLKSKIEQIHSLPRPGKIFWVQASHNPITFKGRPALLSTFKDITEIKEQQMTAQRMAEPIG